MSIEDLYSIYLQYTSIQTDSRKIKDGDLFFALKGDNFDGNRFAATAIDSGAAFAIIDNASFAGGRTILVDDVLTTLQALARYHRQQFKIPFIAITGSNGKTTTKELVHAVLSTTYKTYTTEGNLNNHIGVPLTILRISKDAEMAVIEMGANHQREIASYCVYTLPTHGLITNCGKAHLEGFGGEEGVRKGKGELYDHLRLNNGTAFLMWDYDYLREMSKGIANAYTYGTADADVVGSVVQSEPLIVEFSKGVQAKISSQLVGDYNLPNILAAATVGHFFGVPDDKIQRAIEEYTPSNSRSQLVKTATNEVILDAYNANPSSMKVAIDNFAGRSGLYHEKVLILGAMAELGNDSLYEHEQLVQQIKKHSWKDVLLVGGDFEKIAHDYHQFKSAEDAATWLREKKYVNSSFLVKGSRSMKMEKVLETL